MDKQEAEKALLKQVRETLDSITDEQVVGCIAHDNISQPGRQRELVLQLCGTMKDIAPCLDYCPIHVLEHVVTTMETMEVIVRHHRDACLRFLER